MIIRSIVLIFAPMTDFSVCRDWICSDILCYCVYNFSIYVIAACSVYEIVYIAVASNEARFSCYCVSM